MASRITAAVLGPGTIGTDLLVAGAYSSFLLQEDVVIEVAAAPARAQGVPA